MKLGSGEARWLDAGLGPDHKMDSVLRTVRLKLESEISIFAGRSI